MQIGLVLPTSDLEFIPWFLHFRSRTSVLILEIRACITLIAAVKGAMTSGLGMKNVWQSLQMGKNALAMQIAKVVDVSEVAAS
mmetsp:Transcript_11282/g.27734  ORF Transcript_11282/g.27734 Transcript_11282/m.27734 type:complete len:83 (+) Transcript_11282:272-520(+)